MDPVKHVQETAIGYQITGAWIHNGELLIQNPNGDLKVIARFVEPKPEKERKPRERKNGLAKAVLGSSPLSAEGQQVRTATGQV